ncbi:uncharacterized protein G2W53_031662 [Senna tora]|uniref:Uncharacterized protein n=1 Tax=Senna tora TaxID=362788 RepID=A0A834T949_9FABA|nr:uncharacterized protein G2W53_031662 [Senna tora]
MSPYIYSARGSGIGGLGRADVRTQGLCLIRRSNKKMEFISASPAKEDDGIGARKRIDPSSLRAERPCRLVEGICSSVKDKASKYLMNNLLVNTKLRWILSAQTWWPWTVVTVTVIFNGDGATVTEQRRFASFGFGYVIRWVCA